MYFLSFISSIILERFIKIKGDFFNTMDDVKEWKRLQAKEGRRAFLRNSGIVLGGSALLYGIGRLGAPDAGLNVENINSKDGKVVWHPSYGMPWFDNVHKLALSFFTAGHAVAIKRFPDLSARLVDEGVIESSDVVIPSEASVEDLMLVHTPEYIARLQGLTEGLIPRGLTNPGENKITRDLYDFIVASVGGTYTAGDLALRDGVAVNLSGGFHHAFPHREEGFCFYNDVAIAIKKLMNEGKIDKALIVDLDTHQGNGNSWIFKNDNRVKIFDAYELNNYPDPKGHVDYPIEFAQSVGDVEYLASIKKLDKVLEHEKPDVVFYLAGADPYKEDTLGNQELTKQGLRNRDEFVISSARERGIPCTVVLAGGYSPLEDLVEINRNTVDVVMKG